MKLQSMKRTKKEKKEYEETMAVDSMEGEDYPYGLRIRLEKESLESLGLDVDDFSIGGKVDLVCEAEVVSLSESVNENNSHADVSLQITDLAMKQRPKAKNLRDIVNIIKDSKY